MLGKLKTYFIKAIQTIKNEGFYSFLLKSRDFWQRRLQARHLSDVAAVTDVTDVAASPFTPSAKPSVKDLLDNSFFNTSPIPFIYTEAAPLRINIVVDTLSENSLFGGTVTSIIFSMMLARHLRYSLRVITRDNEGYVKNTAGFYDIAKMHGITTLPSSCEFVCISSDPAKSRDTALEISENDLFISSSWWSSKVITQLNPRKKYIYVLQEYEKIFYPNGDEHLMIDRIFNDPSMIPVVNTSSLMHYFNENNYEHISKNGLCFEPAFPYVTLPNKEKFHQKKEKRNLFFFARPGTPRNLFYTGLELIDSAIELGLLDTQQWNIFFAGSDVPPFIFNDGSEAHILQKMPLSQYASFISDVDLGISLMLAPCPSYAPLDLACAGAAVLTTTYSNKTSLSQYSKNIICANPSKESLLEHLEKAIALSETREARYANLLNQHIHKNWETSFSAILDTLADRINKNLI